MMNLIFDDSEVLFDEMQKEWNTKEDAFFKDHYQLSENSNYNSTSWRKFLAHPLVADWIYEETKVIQQATYRKLLKNIDSNSRSTGLPQLLNSLTDQMKEDSVATGPIFIYTYVPLNEEEKHANNIILAEKDHTLEDLTEL